MGTPITSPKGATDSPRPAHVCQLCNKSYERADHLSRHLDSHRNERTFKCNDCPRGFNRRDLLLRHQATHAKNAANGKNGPDRTAERAIKACDPCVLSKLKCDNSRPCQRCKKRKIECRSDTLNQVASAPTPDHSPSATAIQQQSSKDSRNSLPSPPDTAAEINVPQVPRNPTSQDELAFAGSSMPALQPDQNAMSWSSTDMGSLLPFPSFFEQIMAPDFVASEPLNMPPDIYDWMSEKDWLNDTTDVFGLDFTPTVDEAIQAQIENYPFPEQLNENAVPEGNAPASQIHNNAKERHAIFQRSPWLWKPEANSNAFSEHRSLPLDESEIDMGASPHQPFLPALVLQDRITEQSRDRIFQTVIKAAKSQLSIPRFPSTKCLNMLLKVGLAKRMETDAWIHLYTFDPETSRPELLIALIAAGCVCFGIPSVSKTGLVLFEIVRVALNRLIEDDNSVIRDLQYLQACMIWIDITAFCGFKRKMEIAEHSLQPLVTALRRAGKLDRTPYSQIQPTSSDDTEALDSKWRRWAEQESYKRLVHHLFEHDIYTTIAKVRNPLISYAEMSLPLPASRDLWLAPSAEIWQFTHSGDSAHDNKHSNLSLRDLLADSELLRCLPKSVDLRLAKTARLYGLAAQTWEYYQQSIVCNSEFASNADPSAKLWMQSRHQKLYQLLQSARSSLEDSLAVTKLLGEFLMMSLHVSPDDITRFAGKCGEAEAHRAYQELQPWSNTKQARTAIWHAGQVVRLARLVPPYQLRGPDAFLIYHSLMVLWAYGMIQRDAARRSGTSSPRIAAFQGTGTNPAVRETAVFLDEGISERTDTFLLMGVGTPCLHLDAKSETRRSNTQICDLRNPQAVMAVGIKVFEQNYPNETRQNLPQMIRSLCELMGELGSLT